MPTRLHLFRLSLVVFLGVLCAPAACAAVVYEFAYKQNPPFVIGGPWGVTVDELGDAYATDTGAHRIVKFDSAGNPIKAWGSEGSLPGQFYYPLGIAAAPGPTPGNIRIYVADDGNHRIVVYDSEGQFLSTFGSEGQGNNQFNHPRGISVLPYIHGGTKEICVADTGNDRISCFNAQGQWLKSFNCGDCPGGKFVEPQGIFVQRVGVGDVRYYVTDNYPARVVVFDESGHHMLTMGGPGQAGALGFPDDLVVDPNDGSIFVADSGIGFEQVTKFNAFGEWQFNFRTMPTGGLLQPHAIAIDEEGDLVVGQFDQPPMNKFQIAKPKIKAVADPAVLPKTWLEDDAAYLRVWYNGEEQHCATRIDLSMTADGKPWVIRTSRSGIDVSSSSRSVALPLSARQVNRLEAAFDEGLKVKLVAEHSATCISDGTAVTGKTRSFIQQ